MQNPTAEYLFDNFDEFCAGVDFQTQDNSSLQNLPIMRSLASEFQSINEENAKSALDGNCDDSKFLEMVKETFRCKISRPKSDCCVLKDLEISSSIKRIPNIPKAPKSSNREKTRIFGSKNIELENRRAKSNKSRKEISIFESMRVNQERSIKARDPEFHTFGIPDNDQIKDRNAKSIPKKFRNYIAGVGKQEWLHKLDLSTNQKSIMNTSKLAKLESIKSTLMKNIKNSLKERLEESKIDFGTQLYINDPVPPIEINSISKAQIREQINHNKSTFRDGTSRIKSSRENQHTLKRKVINELARDDFPLNDVSTQRVGSFANQPSRLNELQINNLKKRFSQANEAIVQQGASMIVSPRLGVSSNGDSSPDKEKKFKYSLKNFIYKKQSSKLYTQNFRKVAALVSKLKRAKSNPKDKSSFMNQTVLSQEQKYYSISRKLLADRVAKKLCEISFTKGKVTNTKISNSFKKRLNSSKLERRRDVSFQELIIR